MTMKNAAIHNREQQRIGESTYLLFRSNNA